MKNVFHIDEGRLSLDRASDYVFQRKNFSEISFSPSCYDRVEKSFRALHTLIEKRVPIYGVNTGFGDSLFRHIPLEKSAELQENLISYLLCGTGPRIPKEAARATLFFRLLSLSRGFSGVSVELLDTLKNFLERDWLPSIPVQGSLGASGDLVPLAYIAAMIRGEGEIDTPQGIRSAEQLLREYSVKPYKLKPKEGLTLVNGTSAMCGLALVNLEEARALLFLATTATAWLSLALKGRPEAFGDLVNERAKQHDGQSEMARSIRKILDEERYTPDDYSKIEVKNQMTSSLIQDRYSLRCAPQILGPVKETLDLIAHWIETEINGVSDNPLIDPSGEHAAGGNFYGGYLSQGMDYLKISLGHVADLIDRQLMHIIDEKSNRGLPANLANWKGLPAEDRFLHHGLKGLHQAVSAITSEILAKSIPNGIFSRSSESHNQDKVSLGMSAAAQCLEVNTSLFTTTAMHLVSLAQALDLREVELTGSSRLLYDRIRKHVPFVERDTALGQAIESLALELRTTSHSKGNAL